jgi:hypothetical protein
MKRRMVHARFSLASLRACQCHPARMVAVVLAALTSSVPAAEATNPQIEEIRLSVHPAAPPVPALRYHFMPDLVDQVPGNAALLYLAAAQQMASTRAEPENFPTGADDEKIDRWLQTPAQTLPREEVRALLKRYARALAQFRLAALRDRCDFDPPYRTEGFRTLLPFLNDARPLARLAALSARLKIADGDLDGAVADMALPLVQARHLNDRAVLVQLMVASSVGDLALRQVQELIAQGNAPNLYWALGDLPAPLLDVRAAMKMERASAYFSIPQIKEARAGRLTADQWSQALRAMNDIRGSLHSYGTTAPPEQVMLAMISVKEYPLAKRYLLDHKIPAKDVEAMSVAQAIGLYQVGQFEYWTQELDKGLTLPYWQGIGVISTAETNMRRAVQRNPWSLIGVLGPGTRQAYVTLAKVDRRVALLRTVEAIRAYAAANEGRTPGRLQDITDTPAPVDPLTGWPFVYQVQGEDITVEGPAIDAADPGIRIIMKIVR